MLTQERLKELFSYNEKTGIFTHISYDKKNRVKIPRIAGTLESYGYILITIDRQGYKAHRLAWLYVYGEFPKGHLDHINENKADNRLVNLREATFQQNMLNKDISILNTSGHKGISWCKLTGKWRVSIKHNGKSMNLGRFKFIEDAIEKYDTFCKEHHGEFYYKNEIKLI